MKTKDLNIASTKRIFFAISGFGFFILLGVLTLNGAMYQLFRTMWNHRFSDGSLRHNVYTGFAAVDYLIAMPVSFWSPAVTQYPALKLQSVVLYPALQSLAAWACVEGFRRSGNQPLMLRLAPLSVFVWMWFGTGVFMGLFCFYDLLFHFYSTQTSDYSPEVPYYYAVSLPFASTLAYIWPYILIHFPPAGMTSAQHQQVIAINQFGSIFCYLLVAGGANYLSSNHTDRTPRSRNADIPWIQGTYALFAFFSALVHLASIGTIIQSDNPEISLSKVFIPNFGNMLGTDHSKLVMMAPEVHFFLQWDFILSVLITAIWSTRVIETMYAHKVNNNHALSSALVLLFGVAGYLVNPGTILSVILYIREGFLRNEDGKKNKSN